MGARTDRIVDVVVVLPGSPPRELPLAMTGSQTLADLRMRVFQELQLSGQRVSAGP